MTLIYCELKQIVEPTVPQGHFITVSMENCHQMWFQRLHLEKGHHLTHTDILH